MQKYKAGIYVATKRARVEDGVGTNLGTPDRSDSLNKPESSDHTRNCEEEEDDEDEDLEDEEPEDDENASLVEDIIGNSRERNSQVNDSEPER